MPSSRKGDSGSDLEGNLGKVYLIYICGFLAVAIILAMAEKLGASAQSIGLVLVAVTLATYAMIGFLARTGDLSEYLVAARGIPPVYNGIATAAQWTSAAGFLGLAGTLYGLGYDGLALLIGLMSGFVLMCVLIVPYLRKLGAYTVPDFFAARYGGAPRLLAVIVLAVVSFALLVAQLSAIGLVASRFLGVTFEWAVAGALGVLIVSALPGGVKSVTWTQVAQYFVLLLALMVPIVLVSLGSTSMPLPQLGYGETLQQITALETAMIEKEVADAGTLKPHLAPFLQMDALGFLALVVSLMAGTASLPHLLMRPLTSPTVREARLSVAWAAFFALLIASAIPAYAALAKLQVFRLIEAGTTFEAMPAWLERASRRDLVRIHGVSLEMMEDSVVAVEAGAGSPAAVASHLITHKAGTASAFAALPEASRSALVEAARATVDLGDGPRASAFRQTVLPAAARAAGNETGLIKESGLWLEPNSLVLLLPEMTRQPAVVSALAATGALAAALAAATGVLIALACALGHDLYARVLDKQAPPARRLAVLRLVLLLVATGATYAAVLRPADLVSILAWACSLAAAGLFPAMVLGIWWKRANAWGAAAGMIAGFGVASYYIAGTELFPMSFHELWGPLVPTSDVALEELASLRAAWETTQGEAKAAAWAALEAQARGTPMHAGAASWLGIPSASAAIFGLPAGFLAVVVVSLATPRPWPETVALVDEMRVPKGAEILEQEAEVID